MIIITVTWDRQLLLLSQVGRLLFESIGYACFPWDHLALTLQFL